MFSEKPRTSSAVIFLLCAVILFFHSRAAEQVCSRFGGAIPRGRNRICQVSSKRLSWLDECDDEYHTQYVHQFHAYVGMNLEVKCVDSIAGQKVGIYRGNQTINGSAFHRYSNLQEADAGQYACKIKSDNGTWHSTHYNITVSAEEVAIGLHSQYCQYNFDYNSTNDCCSLTDQGWIVTDSNGIPHSGTFYAYGTENISVRQGWITPAKMHYPGDVGLYVDPVNQSNPHFQVKLNHLPKLVNDEQVTILAIITASNSLSASSRSLCVELYVTPTNYPSRISVNESQPLDTSASVGNLAKFECQFGTTHPKSCFDLYIFRYYQLEDDKLVSVLNYTLPYESIKDGGFLTSYNHGLNVSIIDDKPLQQTYQFTFYIKNVGIKDNGSVFSCSVKSAEQIQWQHNASLTVDPAIELNSTSQEPSQEVHLGYVMSSFAVAVAVVMAVLSTTSAWLCIRRKRRRRSQSLEADRVPLTNGCSSPNMCDSEAGTPVSTELSGMRLPTLQIVEFQGVQQEGLNVKESCSDRDHGYQSGPESHSLDNLYDSSSAGRPSHQTKRIHSNSELHIGYTYTKDVGHGQMNCKTHQKCIVYISYTERKEEWVLDYLKPLIESWRHSEVILHDEDMIPGFTISGERQRLILQAHKVILVVSNDYSDSPWCLYELQHAIHQEPALCRGRIIPIMVDGCQVLPSIVRGVVPLLDSDKNFQLKLKNITSPV